MTTDIAISLPSTYLPKPSDSSPLSTETKSGSIMLVSPNGRRQGVNVIVYQTSLEHFAALYPQKKICRPLGVINLKHTMIEPFCEKQAGFTVQQQGIDMPMSLRFLCKTRDLDSWMSAFASRGHPTLRHQSSLPSVEEDDEA